MSDKDLKQKRAKARLQKVENLKLVKALKTDSEWNVLEEILQEVMATYVIKNPDAKFPSVRQLLEDLTKEIECRYSEDTETRDILLAAIPSNPTASRWIKQPKWNEAVWDRVRDGGLFTKEKRAKMINALFQRGLVKSDNAAKVWLTLSGDYSDKLDITQDKTVEKFREINEILLKRGSDKE